MKYLIRIFLLLVSFFPAVLEAQSDNRFYLNQELKGDTLCIDIFYENSGTILDTLGSSNLRINFDTSSLDISGIIIDYRGNYDVANWSGYKAMTISSNPVDTFFSLNVFNNDSVGYIPGPVPFTEQIARICIPVKDPCGTSGIEWRQNFPFTTVNHYDGTSLQNTSFYGDSAGFLLAPTVTATLPDSIGCDSILYNSNWYFNSTRVYDTLLQGMGCGDSIVIRDLIVNISPNVYLGADTSLCVGQSMQLSNKLTDDQFKLLASDGASSDYFGTTVSISGDWAIVGAYRNDDFGNASGSAYMYRWDGSAWVQDTKLLPSDGAADDNFGISVSISGNIAVVGAYQDDDNGFSGSGSAYVFEWNGFSWVEVTKLHASDPQVSGFFGCDVAIKGGRIIVGAYGADAAYMFEWDGQLWNFSQKLTASDAASGDFFGRAVDIDIDRVIVGANLDDDLGVSSGSAYIFHWDGNSWVEMDKILPSDGAGGEQFGSNLGISGDWAVVGCRNHDHVGNDAGVAYLYNWNGSNWVQHSELLPTGPSVSDIYFGRDVAIEGSVLIVGAKGSDSLANDAGTVYAYEWDGSSWLLSEQIFAFDGVSGDQFGDEVDISGDRVIVGAFSVDDMALNAGGAYIVPTPSTLLWSTGETTDTIDVVVTNDSTIWLQVTSSGGCSSIDTIQLYLGSTTPPLISLFDYDTVCLNDTSIYVSITSDTGYTWYLTQSLGGFGEDSGDSASIGWDFMGSDTLVLQRDSAGCYAYDTMYVEVEKGYTTNYLPDSVGCDSVLYNSVWYTSSVTLYDTIIQSSCGDSLDVINIVVYESPKVALGSDTSVCSSQTIELSNTLSGSEMKLLASDGGGSQYFGSAVSIDGNRAIVGASGAGAGNGEAYIYEWNGTSWIETAQLLASDGAASDYFGASVSVSGDRVIVGAWGDDNIAGVDAGAAYIYEWTGAVWNETKIIASDGAAGDNYGNSVSISGDRAIVGAVYDDGNTGSAYIYEWTGAVWNETKIIASDGFGGDQFGRSVGIDGDRAIVGAPNDDDNGNASGSVYIYEWSGVAWNETKIIASDGAADDYFGFSVDISGDKAIVGAYGDDDLGLTSGSAYIYEWSGAVWNETKILASDGAASDQFARAVSIDGDKAVVGARYDDDLGNLSGSAYVYDWMGGAWTESAKLLAFDGAPSDYLGGAVDVSGGKTILGATGDDDLGGESGSAYIMPASSISKLWSTGEITDTISVAVSSDTLVWLEVSSSDGCANRDSIQIVLSSPAKPNIIGNDTVCLSDSNQYDASIADTGYTWWLAQSLGGFNTTSNDIVNIGWDIAGTDTLYVQRDSAGCSAYDTLYILVGDKPIADAGLDTFVCFGDSVQIGGSPSGTGGTGPLTYTWQAPRILPTYLNDPTLPNPMASPGDITAVGGYELIVTDSIGCISDPDYMNIYVNHLPEVSLPDTLTTCGDSVDIEPYYGYVQTDEFDFGEDMTSHAYTTGGSVGNAAYKGANGKRVNSTINSDWTNDAIRIGNCIGGGFVEVTMAVIPNTDTIILSIASTINGDRGIILIDGMPTGFQVPGNATTANFNDVIIDGVSGLTADGFVVVRLEDTSSTCADIQVSGMTIRSKHVDNDLNYNWVSNPPGFVSFDDSVKVPGTPGVEYLLIADDAYGCSSEEDTTYIDQLYNPKPDLGPDDTICLPDFNPHKVISDVATTVGVGRYAWYVNGFDQFNDLDTLDLFSSFDQYPDTVILQVDSAGNGCFQSDTVQLLVLQQPDDMFVWGMTSGSDTICNGELTTFMYVGGFANYYYEWFVNGVKVDSGDDHFIDTNVYFGDEITVILDSGFYSGRCPNYFEDTAIYYMNPPINADLRFTSADTTLCGPDSLEMIATSIDNGNYQWFRTGDTISGPLLDDSIQFHSIPGDYFVVINDTFGCYDTTQTRTILLKQASKVDLKVLLEGPYSGGGLMTTDLFDHPDSLYSLQRQYENPATRGGLGVGGPYGITMNPGDTVPENGGARAVDVIQLAFRNAPSGAELDTAYAWLMNNGSIRDFYSTDSSFVQVCDLPPAKYHVVVRHRNHLTIMTNDSVDVADPVGPVYDLTDSLNIYTFVPGYVGANNSFDGNGYTMVAGNADSFQQIEAADYVTVLADQNALIKGYLITDIDLNSYVNATDWTITSINNDILKFSTTPNP